MSLNWEKQESGWYTCERGGIVRENGWWFYPIDSIEKFGPFQSLAAAVRVVAAAQLAAVQPPAWPIAGLARQHDQRWLEARRKA